MTNWSRKRPPQNKANLKRSLKFQVPSFKLEKQMVGTSNFALYTRPKAVRAKRTQFPAGPRATRPTGQGGGNSAKQSQFWRRWGIWVVLRHKVNYAKQTQLAAGGTSHHSTIPSFHCSSPIPAAQNKANSDPKGFPDWQAADHNLRW